MSKLTSIQTPIEYLTPEEAGRIIGVQGRTVRDWIKRKHIVFIKLPGGNLRIKKENFERWLEARTTKTKQ